LVIEAGSLGTSGEILVLDMGEPVKILDLAKDLIHLSGLKLGEDIDIEFIGLRPGEKLREELLIDKERAKATRFEKIFVEPPTKIETQQLDAMLQELEQVARQHDHQSIYAALESWFNGVLKQAGSSERFQRSERNRMVKVTGTMT
jgi:FlaA1/EpsC-like NDP-sugar epimerase